MDTNTYRLGNHIFDVCMADIIFFIGFMATFRTGKFLLLTNYIKEKAPWLFLNILTPKWEKINLKICGIGFMFFSLLILAANIFSGFLVGNLK